MTNLLTQEIRGEQDVVLTRQRARHIADLLGFDAQDQTRIATAVSEIARNAFQYAGGGRVSFSLPLTPEPALRIAIADKGPGIRDIEAILEGRYTSRTGMGKGIIGTRRLMDGFLLNSAPGQGTEVALTKNLPPPRPGAPRLDPARIAEQLAGETPPDPYQEVQRQNRELLQALEQLQERQEELGQLNRELNETNRGVVALYAELEEQALSLERASEVKSRFLSYMSHEFRTPVSSIISLARMLRERVDGDLTAEQEKQVRLIQSSADALWEIVNDLLDLARIEAGKTLVQAQEFSVDDVFGALRGMFRPLLTHESPALVFEEAEGLPPLTLCTDEGKLSQILRNFISNALKFTPEGEVRVRAEARRSGDGMVVFFVTDTGIGIAPENLGRIFEEFGQIESAQQKKVKGTGLGLPLSRKLAELLGGSVSVTSEPGIGSTFTLTIPACWPGEEGEGAAFSLNGRESG